MAPFLDLIRFAKGDVLQKAKAYPVDGASLVPSAERIRTPKVFRPWPFGDCMRGVETCVPQHDVLHRSRTHPFQGRKALCYRLPGKPRRRGMPSLFGEDCRRQTGLGLVYGAFFGEARAGHQACRLGWD